MKFVLLLLALCGIFSSSAVRNSSSERTGTLEPKRICIVGNVAKQGEITFDSRLFLTEALARVGGVLPHGKQIIIIEPNTEGSLEIRYDTKVLRRKAFKDHELVDRTVIEVTTQKGYQAPALPSNACPWVPILRNRM